MMVRLSSSGDVRQDISISRWLTVPSSIVVTEIEGYTSHRVVCFFAWDIVEVIVLLIITVIISQIILVFQLVFVHHEAMSWEWSHHLNLHLLLSFLLSVIILVHFFWLLNIVWLIDILFFDRSAVVFLELIRRRNIMEVVESRIIFKSRDGRIRLGIIDIISLLSLLFNDDFFNLRVLVINWH